MTVNELPNDNEDNIDGTILNISDVTVKCEVVSKGESIKINIPKSIFPKDKIHYGTPINLKIVKINNISRPVVTIRTISEEKNDGRIDIIDSLINELL